jgi:hemoglobin/transferrin/lactoferrin receptor protein
MKRYKFLSALLLSILAGSLISTKAESPLKNEIQSEKKTDEIELVVSATKTTKSAATTAGTVKVYKLEDKKSFDSYSSLSDLARHEPGIDASVAPGGMGPSTINRSGFKSYNIRGIDGNRVLLNVDGIRQADEFTFGDTATVGRDYIDLETMKRVEILKGSASTLYGSDAIGGVVSYTTKDATDYLDPLGKPFFFKLKSDFDSANLGFTESLTSAFRQGPLDLLLTYSRRDAQERDTEGNRGANPSDYESNSFLGKIGYQLNPENRLSITGEWLERRVNEGLRSSDGVLLSSAGPQVFNATSDGEVNRHRYSLEHNFKDLKKNGLFEDIKTQVYRQYSETVDNTQQLVGTLGATSPNRLRIRDNHYEEEAFGGSTQAVIPFEAASLDHKLLLGSEVSRTYVDRPRFGKQITLATGVEANATPDNARFVKDVPDTQIIRWGLFAQDEIALMSQDRLTLIPGMRIDYYHLDAVGDTPFYANSLGRDPVNFEEWSASPKVSLIGKPAKDWTTYLNFGVGHRSPTTEDLNGSIENTSSFYRSIPNGSLRSESSYSTEVGYRTENKWIKWDHSFYYNHYIDFINTLTNVGGAGSPGSPTIFQSTNINEARIYGTEVKVEHPLDVWNENLKGFSLFTGMNHGIGDDLEHNRPLNSVNPLKVISGLRFRYEEIWGAEFTSTYTEKKYRVDYTSLANNYIPGDSVALDLTGYWNIRPWARLTAGVYNLADRRYYNWQDVRGFNQNSRSDIDRFSQAGTNFRASLTLEF